MPREIHCQLCEQAIIDEMEIRPYDVRMCVEANSDVCPTTDKAFAIYHTDCIPTYQEDPSEE